MMGSVVVTALLWLALAPPQFEVASVKPSAETVGPDHANHIAYSPSGFSAAHATLKRLIAEAYGLQVHLVTGGPKWLDQAEYEVNARNGSPASKDEIRARLRELLKERFHLVAHPDTRERKVYLLEAANGQPRLKPGSRTLDDFAAMLAVQLTIALPEDPTRPGIASGSVTPVLNRTGLNGEYDLPAQPRGEPGADTFILWQRTLRDELGLKLTSAKLPVEAIVVDQAERTPLGN